MEKLTESLYVRCGKELKRSVVKLAKMAGVGEAEYVRAVLVDDAKFKLGDKYGKR
jgi:hypothetical protein